MFLFVWFVSFGGVQVCGKSLGLEIFDFSFGFVFVCSRGVFGDEEVTGFVLVGLLEFEVKGKVSNYDLFYFYLVLIFLDRGFFAFFLQFLKFNVEVFVLMVEFWRFISCGSRQVVGWFYCVLVLLGIRWAFSFGSVWLVLDCLVYTFR